jgi:capsular polysaccharide biosynthesis protein
MTDHLSHAHGSDGYERSDVNVKMIVIVAVLIVAFLAVSLLVLDQYFEYVTQETIYKEQLAPQSVALRDLRAREAETLNSYKVLDSAKGVYQIPIDRAMQLIAEESYKASQKK